MKDTLATLRSQYAVRQQERKIRHHISKASCCSKQELQLINLEQFLNGHRFLYFHTSNGFGKLAREVEHKTHLARETYAMRLARSLGLRTIDVIQEYTEIMEGYGMILLEKLTGEQGDLVEYLPSISTYDDYSSAERGRIAAATLFANGYQRIPRGYDTSLLVKKGTWAWIARTPSSVNRTICRYLRLLQEPAYQTAFRSVLQEEEAPAADFDVLFSIFMTLPDQIRDLGALSPRRSREYFVHNDAGIKNLFFHKVEGSISSATLIDFEAATSTHYPVLGLLQDLKQFYFQAIFNPVMVREFLTTCLILERDDVPELLPAEARRYLLRAVVTLATFNAFIHLCNHLEQKGLSPESEPQAIREALLNDPDRQHFATLFSSMVGHLDFIEQPLLKLEELLVSRPVHSYQNA